MFLWDSLKFEIFNAQDNELADEAIEVLRSLSERLHGDVSSKEGNEAYLGFLGLLTKECLDRLKEPQQKQAKAATRILSMLASTSPEAYGNVISNTIAQLVEEYRKAANVEKKLAVLESTSQLVRSTPLADHGALQANTEAKTMARFKDDLFSICVATLSESHHESTSLQATALECLSTMCNLKNVLAPAEVRIAVHHFNDVLLLSDDPSKSLLRQRAISGLRTLSTSYPDLIVDETFPTLLSRIFGTENGSNFESYCSNLECLANITIGGRFCDTLVRRLFSRLLDTVQQDTPVRNVEAILSTLNYILATEAVEGTLHIPDYYKRLSELLAIATHGAVGTQPLGPLNSPGAMVCLGRLALTILRRVDGNAQKKIADHVYSLYEETPILVRQPLDVDLPEPRRQTIVLSTYFLAAAQVKVMRLVSLENLADRSHLAHAFPLTNRLADSLRDPSQAIIRPKR